MKEYFDKMKVFFDKMKVKNKIDFYISNEII